MYVCVSPRVIVWEDPCCIRNPRQGHKPPSLLPYIHNLSPGGRRGPWGAAVGLVQVNDRRGQPPAPDRDTLSKEETTDCTTANDWTVSSGTEAQRCMRARVGRRSAANSPARPPPPPPQLSPSHAVGSGRAQQQSNAAAYWGFALRPRVELFPPVRLTHRRISAIIDRTD